METKDILKKVKKIEIKTKRLSDHIFSGEYHTSFKGKGIQGYVSVDDSITYYYGLVFAEYYEYFNKVSRCSLVFDIPKSKLGFDSALRELTYLGSKSAKKELYEETYEPKHVNPVKWWSR